MTLHVNGPAFDSRRLPRPRCRVSASVPLTRTFHDMKSLVAG